MTSPPTDTLDVWGKVAALPRQVSAVLSSLELPSMPSVEAISNVLILGIGDSGFAGHVVAASARPFSPVPIIVHNGYLQPSWVGPSTLVIAISAGGNTEETNESVQSALLSGASLLAITTGGDLADIARTAQSPVLSVSGDVSVPRASLGYLATPAMLALEAIGLFPGASSWLDEAVGVLETRVGQSNSDKSEARRLAKKIGRTIPLIYGGGAVGATAAKRWKAAVNLNVKAPAFSAAMPDLCYDELLGWGLHGDITRQVFTEIQLRHDYDHPQVQRRFTYVEDKTLEVMSDLLVVEAKGEGPIAQLLDLILLGDIVSLEMAAAEGLDPGPVPITHDLRRWLSEGEES